jgi:hypothetical protein
MRQPRQPRRSGARLARAGVLVGLVLATGATPATPAVGAGSVVGRVGSITVAATSLRPAPSGTWTSSLQVSTSGTVSDELDAALAPGAAALGVFHQRVSVGEIPDLASCDGETPPLPVVERWLHYGPLLVPGRASGPVELATATLTVPPEAVVVTDGRVAITLYFARAGQLTLDVPVDRA